MIKEFEPKFWISIQDSLSWFKTQSRNNKDTFFYSRFNQETIKNQSLNQELEYSLQFHIMLNQSLGGKLLALVEMGETSKARGRRSEEEKARRLPTQQPRRAPCWLERVVQPRQAILGQDRWSMFCGLFSFRQNVVWPCTQAGDFARLGDSSGYPGQPKLHVFF